jgi:hypothetical protein
LFARSAELSLGSARKFPYISGLNQRDGQNQKLPFCSGEGGSFQFFPQRFLFRKNLLTKQVFRRGERFLSIPAMLRSTSFQLYQNLTFSAKAWFFV